MAPDPPTVTDPDLDNDRDVVEWGDDGGPQRSRLPVFLTRLSPADLLTHRQLVVGAAVIGGAFIAASLFGDWQVVTLPVIRDGPELGTAQPRSVPVSIGGMGAWGAAYLVGLVGLAALGAIALFGAPASRPCGRLAGLAWGGGLLCVIFAAAASSDERTAVQAYLYYITGNGASDPTVAYGPGPFLAVVGVATATAAVYLSGRPIRRGSAHRVDLEQPAGSEPVGIEPDDAEDVAAVPVRRPPAVGRRAEQRQRPDPNPYPSSGPADLTVAPTSPFIYLSDKPESR